MAATSSPRRRGRPAAASREQVLDWAMHRYLRGTRIDVQALAAELGIGRVTVYRWFGSRDELIGEVVAQAAEPLLANARASTSATGGQALLETFDRFNRELADSPALRQFVEREREAALRVLTSGAGKVQSRMVALIAELIVREVDAGTYVAPIDPDTLAYAIVRLAEAFLFNDAVAGMRGDVDRLIEVEAGLLGLSSQALAPRKQSKSAS
jgi:AcrR family transcriptional regulator